MTERRRLKVLTLVDSARGLGGAERLAAELAIGLDPVRFETTFCATRPTSGDALEGRLRAAGVRTLTLPRGSRADLLGWRPLVSVLVRERPDILHCHKFGSNVWGTILGKLTGVPVLIAHEHVWSFEGHALRRLLDRELVGRHADAFLTVSKETRRQMIEVEGLDPRTVRVLQNGIPPLPAPSHDVRNELGLTPDDLVVGTVGIFRRQKALNVLLRSVALVVREFPTLKVVLVGGGPEEAALRALVDELGLNRLVTFTGPRDNVSDFLAIFDVALLSSDFEGTPLSVIEYMAAGKPVVATSVGGVPDLVEDGLHGLLVRPQDSEGFARAILQLLRDPALRARMGEAGRHRQRDEFSIDVTLRKLELLYEELFRASRRGRAERSQPLRQMP